MLVFVNQKQIFHLLALSYRRKILAVQSFRIRILVVQSWASIAQKMTIHLLVVQV